MNCKECKKECLESELKNGICKECAKKSPNSIVITIVIAVAISVAMSVALSLITVGLANNEVSISDFKIENFDMETEKQTYTYAEDTLTYKGKGTISCKDKNTDYLVLIEQKNQNNNKIEYNYVIVHDGKGEINTYDSNFSGITEKPSYKFNIIGYRSFKK